LRKAILALLSSLPLVSGCDGPRERAGEKADVAAGFTDTTAALRSGPNERLGERLDRLAEEKADRHGAAERNVLALDIERKGN
jgi:hypothetical protein